MLVAAPVVISFDSGLILLLKLVNKMPPFPIGLSTHPRLYALTKL